MNNLLVWLGIGFISGSIPWAVIITKLVSRRNIRHFGDSNPGAANAWKAGGWVAGISTFTFDLFKGIVPIFLATRMIPAPTTFSGEIVMALVCLSPVLGHAWSPLLKLKGGKALATSLGVWTALTNGLVLPIACLCLGLFHLIQRNDAITVTGCLIICICIFVPLDVQSYIGAFGLLNLAVVLYKHRSEYMDKPIFREWVSKFIGMGA